MADGQKEETELSNVIEKIVPNVGIPSQVDKHGNPSGFGAWQAERSKSVQAGFLSSALQQARKDQQRESKKKKPQ